MVNNLVSNSATYTYTFTRDYKLLCLTVLSNGAGYGHSVTVTAGSIKEIIKLATAAISTGAYGAGAHTTTFLLRNVKSGTTVSIANSYGDTTRAQSSIITEIVE